ncbi:hypothetical protein [Photobacterium leiognathi]|uniref:hypothetical protein n=1 Tax=Photobacterium leiognathi TaxID=553611 RepID=UPI002981EB05|nr:hypothetical protein [Photobacterium leiognathi]
MKNNNTNLVADVVKAACGGAKTYQSLIELGKKQSQNPEFTLWGSLTNNLSADSFKTFTELFPNVEAHLVDSSTVRQGESVRDVLTQYSWDAKSGKFNGVLFVSHDSLLNDALTGTLSLANVICDEAPTSAIGLISVKNDDITYKFIERYVQFSVCEVDSNYLIVSLKDDEDLQVELSQTIEAHTLPTGERANFLSSHVIELFQLLLAGYDMVYYSKGKAVVNHYFQAIKYQPAENLIKHSKSLTLLAASPENTLFGILAQKKLGCNFNYKTQANNVELPQLHTHKVRIIPYLVKGNISKDLKNKVTNQATVNREPEERHTVREDMELFARVQLKGDFLYFVNSADEPLLPLTAAERKDKNIIRHRIMVHGLNAYKDFTKAAYIASVNPDPSERGLLKIAAKNLNLEESELLQACITERYLESCYQCLARTIIRCHGVQTDKEIIFVVPDMRAAEYVASKFADGYVTIDTSKGYEVLKETVKSADQKVKELANLAKVKAVLADHKAKVAKLPELFKKHGMSESTFKRTKKAHKEELQALGLIK